MDAQAVKVNEANTVFGNVFNVTYEDGEIEEIKQSEVIMCEGLENLQTQEGHLFLHTFKNP